MRKIISSNIVKRFYGTVTNEQKIRFKWKWIRNRNLTPLLDIKVKHGGGETTLWNILFDKNHCGDFGLRKGGYLRKNYHDEWLEIKENDWNLIQKHANDKFNFRYLDWEKKKEAVDGDVFVSQGVIYEVDSKTLCLSREKDIEVGTGILTDRLTMERQISDQAVNQREYIFRLIYKRNNLYRTLEEDKRITSYFNTQAQIEADNEGKTLSEKLVDYREEILVAWGKDGKEVLSTLNLPRTSMSEMEKEKLVQLFLTVYMSLLEKEVKERKDIINYKNSSQEQKQLHSEKMQEYEAKIEKVKPYIIKINKIK